MYCYKCGSELSDSDKFCGNCGAKAQQIDELESRVNHLESAEASRDSGSVGWTVLGFFIPIVGLILFLVWLRSKPNNSNAAGAGCLAGILIWYVLPFVFPIFV